MIGTVQVGLPPLGRRLVRHALARRSLKLVIAVDPAEKEVGMWLDTRLRSLGLLVAALALLGIVGPGVYGEESDPDRTLVLHYTFDYPDTMGLPGEERVVKDHSLYGNDGKIANQPEALRELDGRQGVLRFGGEETYINCGNPESLDIGGDMSFEMWARLNGLVKSRSALFFGEHRGDFHFGLQNWRILRLWYSYGGGSMLLPVDRNILSDRWSHIAVVVEYPRCRFYHNGKLVRDAYMPIPGMAKRKNVPKYIAGVPDRGGCPIDLDEFRMYRRALTAAEIEAHAMGKEVSPGQADELAVEPHWYEDTVAVRLSCKGTDYKGHTAEMTLLKGDYTEAAPPKRVSLTEAFGGSGRYVATGTFPLSDLKITSLDAVVRILGPDGKLVKRLNRHASLRKPDWVHTKEGYSDEVMPPWTPLEAERRPDGTMEVRVWGRRHVFGATPFPQQIETRGKEILTSPITLEGRVNGKAIAWENGRVRLKEASNTAASLEQVFEDDRATLRVDTRIEYDGYMIFDCEVKARRDLSLDELTLEIPLRSRHATLCYGDKVYPEKKDPRIPMSVFHSGAVRGDLAFRFSPNIWLGDEERGLCWQAESDEDWHYAEEQKAIEILPRGETTTLRAHLVNVPTRLGEGEALRYKFALLATPIKPLLRTSWDLRIVRSDPYGEDLNLPDRKTDGKPTLEYYADAGVKHLFSFVNDLWPYPMPVTDEFSQGLHRLMATTHAHGLKLYQYALHLRFPVAAPEFDIHGLHMSLRPLSAFQYGGTAPPPRYIGYHGAVDTNVRSTPLQGTVRYCPKSKALQDACIHSLARRLDEYGDDGVYLDGTAVHIKPCQNTLHGCGYRTADGSIRTTYPMFADREFLKRIYTVVKLRRPDGVVDVHCSFGYNPSGLAYADILWTGEQWWHLKGKGAKDGYISAELPLDMFRTAFMGYQLGVAAETLEYRLAGGHVGDGRRKVLAISLLHDIPVRVRTQEQENFRMFSKLWKLRDQFGAKEAEKLFYWNNQDYVSVSPEKCYATLLKHPENGVLAFISNLRPDGQTATVQFNLDKLGLRNQKLDVFNALTDEPMAMTSDGKLSVPLGSEDWLYIRLRPKTAKGK